MLTNRISISSGLDPLVFCTLCGVASSAVGYMIGCALYGAVWQWMNKDLALKIKEVRYILNKKTSFQTFKYGSKLYAGVRGV